MVVAPVQPNNVAVPEGLPDKSWTDDQLGSYLLQHGMPKLESAWHAGMAYRCYLANHAKDGKTKEENLKTWLAYYSPDISRATLYRWSKLAKKPLEYYKDDEDEFLTLMAAYEKRGIKMGKPEDEAEADDVSIEPATSAEKFANLPEADQKLWTALFSRYKERAKAKKKAEKEAVIADLDAKIAELTALKASIKV